MGAFNFSAKTLFLFCATTVADLIVPIIEKGSVTFNYAPSERISTHCSKLVNCLVVIFANRSNLKITSTSTKVSLCYIIIIFIIISGD